MLDSYLFFVLFFFCMFIIICDNNYRRDYELRRRLEFRGGVRKGNGGVKYII